MGRLLLLTVAAGVLWTAPACAPGSDAVPSAGRGTTSEGHAELACVSCHRGDAVERGEAAVPPVTCAGSGCHTDGGPGEVTFAGVTFQHRGHGADSARIAMTCVGCHTHAEGDEPILAGSDACALCHASQLSGRDGGDCHVCHADPGHEGFTSQGVGVAHEGLPWIQGECVRCHYDVAEPPRTVSPATCTSCHADRAAITQAGIGVDLHPSHTDVACTSCHTSGGHRIVAMSSAVVLECSHCHVTAHEVDIEPERLASATCNACHGDTHGSQQRLVLGALPDLDAVPSEKFLDGLTCRSCHVPLDDVRAARIGGSASCTGCHRSEFATVLRWWREGTDQRRRAVEGYVARAERALADTGVPDTATALLQEARALVAAVVEAGGEHNLPLTHRVFGESLDRTALAYRAAGRTVPPRPEMGRRPRMGICSYCHYRTDDALALRTLTASQARFHRDVLGVAELARGGAP